ncbi:hypothetical protein OH77DRAFT_1523138 [Trametes cingulata]|nr:hypothetical protein OH77DRAFT_1523138 [Trametes cingulata]
MSRCLTSRLKLTTLKTLLNPAHAASSKVYAAAPFSAHSTRYNPMPVTALDDYVSDVGDEGDEKDCVVPVRKNREIREHPEKTRLSCSVPTLSVLQHLSLKPEGKIDKPAPPLFTDPGPVAPPASSHAGTGGSPPLRRRPAHPRASPTRRESSGPQQSSIFRIRKAVLLDALLRLGYVKPAIAALAAGVDYMCNADLGLAGAGESQSDTAHRAHARHRPGGRKAELGDESERAPRVAV